MPARPKRSIATSKKAKAVKTPEKNPPRSKSKNATTSKKDTTSRTIGVVAEESGEEDDFVEQYLEGSGVEDDEIVSEVGSLDSDALDEEDEEANGSGKNGRKRRRASTSSKKAALKKTTNAKAKTSPNKGSAAPRKRRKVSKASEDEAEEESDFELEEGQEIVGVVVQAPKSGRGAYTICAPPGVDVVLFGVEFANVNDLIASAARADLEEHIGFSHAA